MDSTHGVSKTGEIVSMGNELGAKSEGVVVTPAVLSSVVAAQLLPVAPDLECLLRALSRCSVAALSVVEGNAIQGQLRPCVREQPYSSRCKQQYQMVVVSKEDRLKAHRLF